MKKPTVLKKVATALAMTAICCSTLVPTMAKAEIQPRGCGTNNHNWYQQNFGTKTEVSTHPYQVRVTNSQGESWMETRTCTVTRQYKTYDQICHICGKLEINLSQLIGNAMHSDNCGEN